MSKIKEFIEIWNNYYHILSIDNCEFDTYNNIINKLKEGKDLKYDDKIMFLELINIMAEKIYLSKYKTNYYCETKKYKEPELNCCSYLINFLHQQIIFHHDNEYDKAFTQKYGK